MWQKTVYVDKKYRPYVKNLSSAFEETENLTVAESETKSGTRFSLAASDESGNAVKRKVDDEICNFLLESVKFDFLTEKSGCLASTPSEAAVVAAMLYFDVSGEPPAVKSVIENLDTVSVDGVFNFALGTLKNNWEEIVSLSKNILSVSADPSDLLSVAGFISASGEEGGASLLVYDIGSKNYLKNLTLKSDVKVPMLYEDEELNLVTAVVKQHPNRIILESNNLSAAAKSALKSLAAIKKA